MSHDDIYKGKLGQADPAENVSLSRVTQATDDGKISSGVSRSHWGDDLIEIVQYVRKSLGYCAQ